MSSFATDDPTTVLLDRARQGDRAGLDALVGRLTPWLLVQARVRLAGRLSQLVDPEDLVQDVWLRALPNLGALQARAGRRTPVLVRYLATTLIRRLRDLIARDLIARERGLDPARGVTEAMAASVAGAFQSAIVRERAALLWNAVARLDPRDRQLVVLRGIERSPMTEVAAILGLSPNAASLAWRRARQRLRALLEESAELE
ncbi:MAG: sigma-70 family RNA polymerase sigma factor [Planctomycetes bacterium]|nr:sigma-70 family RNA polymerase sigma factor [Planctomycetota bacterium]